MSAKLHAPSDISVFEASVDAYIDMFAACVVRDAILSATATYWERRASELETALTRPTDFLGRSTPMQRATRQAALEAKITACRSAAAFWRHIAAGTPLQAAASAGSREAA